MEDKAENKLKILESKKQTLFLRIQRVVDLGKSLDNDPKQLENFEVRYKTLENTVASLHDVVMEINSLKLSIDNNASPDFAVLDAVDEMYGFIQIIAERILNKTEAIKASKLGNKNKDSDTGNKPGVRLPKVELKSFDGNVHDWPVFYEMFDSLINRNRNLSDAEKAYYLVGKLSGKALSVCAGIPATADNYDIMWKSLVEKYQDTRFLANSYLQEIFNFKPLNTDASVSLNTFLERFDASVSALKNLKIEDLADYMFIYLTLEKLHPETVKNFEMQYRDRKTFPKYSDVVQFIKDQAKVMTFSKAKPIGYVPNKSKTFHTSLPNKSICFMCNHGSHLITDCQKFLKLNCYDRYKVVKENNLCLLCLLNNHKVADCRNKQVCCHCKGRHHELLHFVKKPTLLHNTDNSQSENSENTKVVHSLCSIKDMSRDNTILLSTIVVYTTDHWGARHKLRFLLDGGSQSNFLCLNLCKRLGLNAIKKQLSVSGIGDSSKPIKGAVKLTFTSRFDDNNLYATEFLLLDKITDKLPTLSIDISSLDYLKTLDLADDSFYTPGRIDGILGANAFAQIVGDEKIVGPENSPIALKTSLGFVVMGKAPVLKETLSFKSFCSFESLDKTVTRFFELEDIPSISGSHSLSTEDQYCEENFSKTQERNSDGRYMVSLPFKDNRSILGDSYHQAKNRFLCLERKLEKNSELRVAYDNAMRDYLNQNHIAPVKEVQENSSYFIPHHGVLKDSSSTPLRIVFDASMKTSTSRSLNDILYTGPKLQLDIFELLLTFRLFSVAVTADLRQMYRQILLKPSDRSLQRLLWRFSPEHPLDIFEICTLAFGVRSSPFLALRTVHQLADDESYRFPEASKVIKKSFYMDDLVCSFESEEEAERLCADLMALFATGKFELVKWASNSSEVLKSIPNQKTLNSKVEFEEASFKILGLEWCPIRDNFSFRLKNFNTHCSKRNILSLVAQIFDPLGILAPVVMFAKLLIKECWRLNLEWDSKPPDYLQDSWRTFCEELNLVSGFEIPRHIGIFSSSVVTLIGFADSSEKGLGTVVYLRSGNGDVCTVRLLCAKSKVSPLKAVTIPRLELCSAVMLAKLVSFICRRILDKVIVDRIVALVDSMVVLNWINKPSSCFKTFVANRVGKIQECTSVDDWYHISGQLNMADCVSRGLTPSKFLNKNDWTCGSSWLLSSLDKWPIQSLKSLNDLPEQKTLSLPLVDNRNLNLDDIIEKSSSWTRLTRVLVYVLRFLRILANTRDRISLAEIDFVENLLFRLIQKKYFNKEIQFLEGGHECSSHLQRLRPFMKDGIIRVGGRLAHADIPYSQKHPVLLPKGDHLIDLIVDHYHCSNFHCGPSLLLGLLRQRFWILSARNIVRKRIHLCNYCFRFRPKSVFPLMADLPKPRVSQAKAFLHTGVDYAGPFKIVMSRYRGCRSQKAYICLFICLCTKAVHLELASDLSTATFLAAFKRFLSRRGPCSIMYSDCGTNFIGARTALGEIYRLFESSEFKDSIHTEMLKNRIEWKFNPPKAPHFGGLWEGNIKSCKTLLSRVIGDQILSFEEFSTVLAQVEALMNSRPISCLSSDPSEPEALTPAHFLTLTPLKHLPAPEISEDSGIVNRKLLLDKLVQSFWKRWRLEYLSGLQVRSKWTKPSQTVTIGTVVVLISDNVPPLQWPLGVIAEVYPGQDNIIRVALVRTKSGLVKRPLVKLCPLPTQ